VLLATSAVIAWQHGLCEGLAREMRHYCRFNPIFRTGQVLLSHSFSKTDQRKWARLKLAIPVFVRTRGENGKDSLEFATAINVSPGGALVVARRSLSKSAWVSLEIPSAPIAPVTGLPGSSRIMRAKAVWVKHLDDYHLLGLKFARPLGTDDSSIPRMRLRKARSAV